MLRETRRDFLRHAALAGGALASGAVGCCKEGDKPKEEVQAQEQAVDLAVARFGDGMPMEYEGVNEIAQKLTEQAIADLGGMKRFVSKGDVVWIKPNIGFCMGPEFATNTNPDVVSTLVRLCLDAGAKSVKVGDNSCYGAKGAYPLSGIEAAVKAVGGEVVYLDPDKFKEMPVNGQRIDKWLVYPDMVESDLLINVPIAKQHALTAVTLCMKNYMGVIGGPRDLFHNDMPMCLTDITAFMKPQLSVLDAVRVLVRNGPMGGDLADVESMGTIAAGTDVVGLEAFGAELLGVNPAMGKTMRQAEERGLGRRDYRSLFMRESELA